MSGTGKQPARLGEPRESGIPKVQNSSMDDSGLGFDYFLFVTFLRFS